MLQGERDQLETMRSHLQKMGASHIEGNSNSLRVQFRIGGSLYKVCIFLNGRSLVCETPFYKVRKATIPAKAQEFLLRQNGAGPLKYALVPAAGDSWVVTAQATLSPGSTSPYELKQRLDEIHHAYQTTIRSFKMLVDK